MHPNSLPTGASKVPWDMRKFGLQGVLDCMGWCRGASALGICFTVRKYGARSTWKQSHNASAIACSTLRLYLAECSPSSLRLASLSLGMAG
jgi:hypothetical protein